MEDSREGDGDQAQMMEVKIGRNKIKSLKFKKVA